MRWSGAVNFHRMQMSLLMSVWFIFGDDWNDVPCKSLFWYLTMMYFLWNRGPWIRVFIHAYSLLLERYFWSSLTRVLNQFRNKKYPCKGSCKRKSYETICENIVSWYQTLVSSLPQEAVFPRRRPKAHFMTGRTGSPVITSLPEIKKVIYMARHFNHRRK